MKDVLHLNLIHCKIQSYDIQEYITATYCCTLLI